MDGYGSSDGSADFEDLDDDEVWRAEEAAADEEHRLAEEALAEEAAAEELTLDAVHADLVEEEEAWMTEDDMADEAWLLQSQELLEQFEEEHFEDALESLEQDPYGDMGESDDDISLADFAHQPDPIPDFNDWGNDPFGADKAAALSFNLNWKKIWEVPKVPLGTAELWQFGPNGPPMNVMDTCPVSNMLWIANQQELFGFPLPTLEDPNSCNDLMEFTRISASRGQINRLRCGQLGRQPVVVAVDAAGGVLVAPTHKSKMSPMKLLNVASGRDQGVSTWGIGLSPTDEGSDAGPLLVSANDHCLKAWWLSDPPEPSMPSGGYPNATPQRSRNAWQLQQMKGRSESDKSPMLLWHFGENLPSIDVIQKRAIVASLGGEVSVLNLVSPSKLESADVFDVHIIEEHPQLDQDLCCKFPPRWPLHEDHKTVRCFGHAESRRVWNVCWIPLASIRTVSSDTSNEGLMDDTLEWTSRTGGSSSLPGEIIRAVLSLLGPQELLQRIQCLNRQHAHLAQEQVSSGKRTEQMALIFSENTVWLTDGCLNMRCKQTLPFNGAFAHVVRMSTLSAVVVSTKMGSANYPLWAVTVLRRKRSLRFELRVKNLAVETDFRDLPWPRNIIVGMAAADDRLFILYSSCRLVCYRLALENTEADAKPELAEALEQAEARE